MKTAYQPQAPKLPDEGFTGSFKQYLRAVKKTPALSQSAKARLYWEILKQGINWPRTEELRKLYNTDDILAYNAFKEFFGVERPIHDFVKALASAMNGGEEDNQAFVLIGPAGSAKSQFMKKLKKILRRAPKVPYCRFGDMRINPLNLLFLIPEKADARAEARVVEEGLSAEEAASVIASYRKEARIKEYEALGLEEEGLLNWENAKVQALFEGIGDEPSYEALCNLTEVDDIVSAIVFALNGSNSTRANIGYPEPKVRDRVLGNFLKRKGQVISGLVVADDEEAIEIADYPIASFRFKDDQQGSVGIASVKEVQPLSYDNRVFIGEENIGNLGNVQRSDPASVDLIGAYNLGNRGLLEGVEFFKNPKEAHRSVLEATQDKSIPAPDPLRINLHVDMLIAYHSNAAEFDEFRSDKKNEPYMSRFVVFYFPYALEMSAQEKIISKLWNMSDLSDDPENGGVFLDPFVIPTLARFATATHLEPSKIVADIMTKIDLYNGNDQRQKGQGTGVDVSELRREATPYEGLLGVDTRWCIKRLNSLASASLLGERSVTSRDMYAAIKESLRLMDEETAKKYEAFLKPLAEHRRKALARVLLAAMVENFEPQCDSQFNRYIANVLAYNKKQKVAASGGVMKAPDEDYMRKVETFPELGITTSQAKDWRAEVASQYSDALLNSGGKLPGYKSYEPLARAIEASVCSNVKPYAASILAAQQAGNEEDKEKYATVKETLIKRYKFDEHSAEELLKEAEETADFLKDF